MYDMIEFTTTNYLCDDEFCDDKLKKYINDFLSLYNIFVKQDTLSSLMDWYEIETELNEVNMFQNMEIEMGLCCV